MTFCPYPKVFPLNSGTTGGAAGPIGGGFFGPVPPALVAVGADYVAPRQEFSSVDLVLSGVRLSGGVATVTDGVMDWGGQSWGLSSSNHVDTAYPSAVPSGSATKPVIVGLSRAVFFGDYKVGVAAYTVGGGAPVAVGSVIAAPGSLADVMATMGLRPNVGVVFSEVGGLQLTPYACDAATGIGAMLHATQPVPTGGLTPFPLSGGPQDCRIDDTHFWVQDLGSSAVAVVTIDAGFAMSISSWVTTGATIYPFAKAWPTDSTYLDVVEATGPLPTVTTIHWNGVAPVIVNAETLHPDCYSSFTSVVANPTPIARLTADDVLLADTSPSLYQGRISTADIGPGINAPPSPYLLVPDGEGNAYSFWQTSHPARVKWSSYSAATDYLFCCGTGCAFPSLVGEAGFGESRLPSVGSRLMVQRVSDYAFRPTGGGSPGWLGAWIYNVFSTPNNIAVSPATQDGVFGGGLNTALLGDTTSHADSVCIAPMDAEGLSPAYATLLRASTVATWRTDTSLHAQPISATFFSGVISFNEDGDYGGWTDISPTGWPGDYYGRAPVVVCAPVTPFTDNLYPVVWATSSPTHGVTVHVGTLTVTSGSATFDPSGLISASFPVPTQPNGYFPIRQLVWTSQFSGAGAINTVQLIGLDPSSGSVSACAVLFSHTDSIGVTGHTFSTWRDLGSSLAVDGQLPNWSPLSIPAGHGGLVSQYPFTGQGGSGGALQDSVFTYSVNGAGALVTNWWVSGGFGLHLFESATTPPDCYTKSYATGLRGARYSAGGPWGDMGSFAVGAIGAATPSFPYSIVYTAAQGGLTGIGHPAEPVVIPNPLFLDPPVQFYSPLLGRFITYGYQNLDTEPSLSSYAAGVLRDNCCGPTVTPPTRIFPRDDNQGISTARVRIGRSQPSSRQQSYRQGFRGTYT